ncbi:MAG: hypothetical protein OEL77_00235 [Nitrosopumilus sp.]|nr:hypothetical protein [Nitrosopumilus sp.]MDH3384430.1 hypothetical protein [Nitrosopumilus sp.]
MIPAPNTISSEDCVVEDIDQVPVDCTVNPDEVSLQLEAIEETTIPKKYSCNEDFIIEDMSVVCPSNSIEFEDFSPDKTDEQTFDELIKNLGDTSKKHCIVTFEIEFASHD